MNVSGKDARFTIIASIYQNGSSKLSIGMAKASMRAMLTDTGLPLGFWDEAVTVDIYLRNRTKTWADY
jgi:hypothetical protein